MHLLYLTFFNSLPLHVFRLLQYDIEAKDLDQLWDDLDKVLDIDFTPLDHTRAGMLLCH